MRCPARATPGSARSRILNRQGLAMKARSSSVALIGLAGLLAGTLGFFGTAQARASTATLRHQRHYR